MTKYPIVCKEELLLALLRYLPDDTVYLGGCDEEDTDFT
jgi:hypothetical protein